MSVNISPMFDEDDDYSYSTTGQSCQSSLSGSFQDERSSFGDASSDKFSRRYFDPFTSFSPNTFRNVAAGRNGNKKYSICAFGLQSPGSKAKKKADIDRAKRMIERLNQAEMQIRFDGGSGGSGGNCGSSSASDWREDRQGGGTRQSRGKNDQIQIRNRAGIQWRLSQIDIARNFYQKRISQKMLAGPVPMEILKIVKSVSAPNSTPRSSREVL